MATRAMEKLSAAGARAKNAPGMYGDGKGLWLHVTASGVKSWIFRYTRNGRTREMGLGPYHTVTLADARRKAQKCREMLLDGIDPIEARRTARFEKVAVEARAISFEQAARAYITAHQAGWKNPKHAAQWPASLESYVFPTFGSVDVRLVDVAMIMKALEPIWTEKTETASRVRGRIESVLDWAIARGFRKGENPARWRGHLENLLPKPSKVVKVKHHAALAHKDLASIMSLLRHQSGVAAVALEFTILTAARTNEVLGSTWSEIDFDGKIWTIPATRMKAGKEHRIPLVGRVLAILEQMRDISGKIEAGIYVFPGQQRGRPLSNMAMLMLLKRMGLEHVTVHGFRSTFRDWAAERTHFPNEVVEMALAHNISNKAEAAYRRGDMLERRREVMEAWSAFATLDSKSNP